MLENTKYAAHPSYWMFAGLEDWVDESKFDEREGSNSWVLPINKLNLSSEFENLQFIRKINRVFFTIPGHSKTICSNYFPDTSLANSESRSKGILQYAKVFLANETFQKTSVPDMKTIRILASRDLFMIGDNFHGQYYITKIVTNQQFGFPLQKFINNELLLEHPISEEDEIEIFDINQFEVEIIVFYKSLNKVYTGRLNHSRKNPVKFKLIDTLDNETLITICLLRGIIYEDLKPNQNQLAILDQSQEKLKIYNIDSSGKTSKFLFNKSFQLEEAKYRKIQFFSSQSEAIMKFTKEGLLNFVILFTEDQIFSLNLQTGRQSLIIGGGNVDLDEYSKGKNPTEKLTNFKLNAIEKAICIPDTAIMFGGKYEMYAILTQRARHIFAPNSNGPKKSNNTFGDS